MAGMADSLHWSSAISILLAVIFVVITVAVTLFKLAQGTIDFSSVRWTPRFDSAQALVQLCTVIPTMATAYVCHYNGTRPLAFAAKLPAPRVDYCTRLKGKAPAS